MADIQFTGLKPLKTQYRDLGNGAWAEVVAFAGVTPAVWAAPTTAYDARAYGSVTITVTTAPSVAYTPQFSPDGTNWFAMSGIDQNFNTVTSISGTGVFTFQGGGFIRLNGGTGGVFQISGSANAAASNGGAFIDSVTDGRTTTGSLSAVGALVSVSNQGYGGGSFQIIGPFVANAQFEQSNDGVNWSLLFVQLNVGTGSPQSSTGSSAGGIFQYFSNAAFVRIIVTAYTSGTVTVALTQKRTGVPVSSIGLAGSTATIGNLIRCAGYSDSLTNLGISGVFVGTVRTSLNTYTKFTATVFADQAGTLSIELSTDTGATYRTIASVAVVASVAQQLTVQQTGVAGSATLYRVRYTNGAVAQTAFQLSSAFLA